MSKTHSPSKFSFGIYVHDVMSFKNLSNVATYTSLIRSVQFNNVVLHITFSSQWTDGDNAHQPLLK